MDLVEANNTGKLNDQLITDYLERIKDKRAGVLVVPDISQLKNGGRVSNFKSILIKLLGLKLIITLDKFGLLFKDKSSKPEDAVKRANSILSTIIPLGKLPIKRFVVFTNSNSDKKFDIKHYVDILKILYPQTKMEFTNVPSVITAHVGPNYLAFGADLD
jgi:fatty acid-binding protein DegV